MPEEHERKERQNYVQMNRPVRRAVSHAKYWYKPLILTALSPIAVMGYALKRGVVLPNYLIHPVTLHLVTLLSIYMVWEQNRRTLNALGLTVLFALSDTDQRHDINNYYTKGGK